MGAPKEAVPKCLSPQERMRVRAFCADKTLHSVAAGFAVSQPALYMRAFANLVKSGTVRSGS